MNTRRCLPVTLVTILAIIVPIALFWLGDANGRGHFATVILTSPLSGGQLTVSRAWDILLGPLFGSIIGVLLGRGKSARYDSVGRRDFVAIASSIAFGITMAHVHDRLLAAGFFNVFSWFTFSVIAVDVMAMLIVTFMAQAFLTEFKIPSKLASYSMGLGFGMYLGITTAAAVFCIISVAYLILMGVYALEPTFLDKFSKEDFGEPSEL